VRWIAPTRPPSPHFTWTEVTGNSGYSRVPLGPTPVGLGRICLTPRLNARRHAANLERLRSAVNEARRSQGLSPVGFRVISWARSYAHNKAVGGASNSQHLYFLATDISVQEIDRICPWPGGRVMFDQLLEVVFAQGGVGLYPAGNRHVDSRGSRARWTSILAALSGRA
jgi:uncharacterized protein YcbK (DUF882 family)